MTLSEKLDNVWKILLVVSVAVFVAYGLPTMLGVPTVFDSVSNYQESMNEKVLLMEYNQSYLGQQKNIIEITNIGRGYTQCRQIKKFPEDPSVRGAYSCSTFENTTHPIVRQALNGDTK